MGDNNSKCCKCVEEMADQLKKFKGQGIVVFEKNAYMVGNVRKVKDDSVLVLDTVTKFVFFNADPNVFVFDRLFISICEITEFGIDPPPGITE